MSYAQQILQLLEKVLDYEDLQKIHRKESLGGGLGYVIGGVGGHVAAHVLGLHPIPATGARLGGGEVISILGRKLGSHLGHRQLRKEGKL